MEVKVVCSCGQKYVFEVQPANGRMPSPVACPTCGADGTALANLRLQELGAGPPGLAIPRPHSAAGPLRIGTPAPAAAAPTPPPPPPPSPAPPPPPPPPPS